jgi:hypothetical protein
MDARVEKEREEAVSKMGVVEEEGGKRGRRAVDV